MQKSPQIRGNMAVFDHLIAKTRIFFKISTWNFVHVYTWQDSFTYIPVFWKFEKFSHFFENYIFVDYFFTILKIFKTLKIRDNKIAPLRQSRVKYRLEPSRLYLQLRHSFLTWNSNGSSDNYTKSNTDTLAKSRPNLTFCTGLELYLNIFFLLLTMSP